LNNKIPSTTLPRLSKGDVLFSVITGATAGLIVWRICEFLGIPRYGGVSYGWLVMIVPTLWMAGVRFGYFLSRWHDGFAQFGRFSAIGFTNASIDFGVLNLLMAVTGLAAGFYFSLFKALSFAVATIHSYFWNKYWSFEALETGFGKVEMLKFFAAAGIAVLVNVTVASLAVNFGRPVLVFSPEQWANVGAVAGAAAALLVSFTGFKWIVFDSSVRRESGIRIGPAGCKPALGSADLESGLQSAAGPK
jgi:putative flippase GtrA